MEDLASIKEKAKWCLNCPNKPCSSACPMHTKIPDFIAKIKEDKFNEAYQILIQNNLLSHVCGLVCPQEQQCQGSCVRGIKSNPVQIGSLETFINDWAYENNIYPEIEISKIKNCDGVKVAIIGAGPAGLSVAFELAKRGVKAIVYEKEKSIGGLLEYGIPDFRLDKKILTKIQDILERLGVEFKFNQELGKDISIKELKKEYQYIFIGIGAEIPSTYSLSDKEIKNVYDFDEFLRKYNSQSYIDNLLEKVVVIGGGNVAMDVARSAIRMGAKEVSILYRRDKEHMPARQAELDDAIREGVKFVPLTRVDRAISDNGKIKKLICNRTKIVDNKAVDIEGETFEYEADTVVFAIGLKPNKKLLEEEGIRLKENGETSIENVYCGGDVVENKSVVCRALASGKKSANLIIEKVMKGE